MKPFNSMQAFVDGMLEMSRVERSRYHLTLGKLIEALRAADKAAPVEFDNGGSPCAPHSYRGYYSDLAFEANDFPVTAQTLLQSAEFALGETFEGYKGGDFKMVADTPLWQAEYGCCGRAVVGVSAADGKVILNTKDVDE